MNANDVIRRLCVLQAKVSGQLGNVGAADCFCGEGGFWKSDGYNGTFDGGYRNDGKAIEFIEQAVAEKIERMKSPQTGDEPT